LKNSDILLVSFGVTLLVILFLLAQSFYLKFLEVATPSPEGSPDIPALLLSYFTNPMKLMNLWNQLLTQQDLPGSSTMIRYSLIPAILIPIFYIFQERIRVYLYNFPTIFYASYSYMFVLAIAIFILQSINGIAQFENLYWNEVAQTAGTFDFATHANTGVTIFLCLMPIPWASWFRVEQIWRPASGYFDNLFNIAIVAIVSWHFEYNESLHPERYMNYIGNAQSDVVANIIVGFLVTYLIYSKLVDRYTRSYDG
jgi:hypothetical protein